MDGMNGGDWDEPKLGSAGTTTLGTSLGGEVIKTPSGMDAWGGGAKGSSIGMSLGASPLPLPINACLSVPPLAKPSAVTLDRLSDMIKQWVRTPNHPYVFVSRDATKTRYRLRQYEMPDLRLGVVPFLAKEEMAESGVLNRMAVDRVSVSGRSEPTDYKTRFNIRSATSYEPLSTSPGFGCSLGEAQVLVCPPEEWMMPSSYPLPLRAMELRKGVTGCSSLHLMAEPTLDVKLHHGSASKTDWDAVLTNSMSATDAKDKDNSSLTFSASQSARPSSAGSSSLMLFNSDCSGVCRVDYETSVWLELLDVAPFLTSLDRLNITITLFRLRTVHVGQTSDQDPHDRCVLLLHWLRIFSQHHPQLLHSAVWSCIGDHLLPIVTSLRHLPSCREELAVFLQSVFNPLLSDGTLSYAVREKTTDYQATKMLSVYTVADLLDVLAAADVVPPGEQCEGMFEWVMKSILSPLHFAETTTPCTFTGSISLDESVSSSGIAANVGGVAPSTSVSGNSDPTMSGGPLLTDPSSPTTSKTLLHHPSSASPSYHAVTPRMGAASLGASVGAQLLGGTGYCEDDASLSPNPLSIFVIPTAEYTKTLINTRGTFDVSEGGSTCRLAQVALTYLCRAGYRRVWGVLFEVCVQLLGKSREELGAQPRGEEEEDEEGGGGGRGSGGGDVNNEGRETDKKGENRTSATSSPSSPKSGFGETHRGPRPGATALDGFTIKLNDAMSSATPSMRFKWLQLLLPAIVSFDSYEWSTHLANMSLSVAQSEATATSIVTNSAILVEVLRLGGTKIAPGLVLEYCRLATLYSGNAQVLERLQETVDKVCTTTESQRQAREHLKAMAVNVAWSGYVAPHYIRYMHNWRRRHSKSLSGAEGNGENEVLDM